MSDEEYKLLIDSLGSQIIKNQQIKDADKQAEVSRMLVKETLKFRNKLKEDTGYVLTVEDTQKALNALETHLNNEKFPKGLSPEQKALAQILIDTIVLFKHGF